MKNEALEPDITSLSAARIARIARAVAERTVSAREVVAARPVADAFASPGLVVR